MEIDNRINATVFIGILWSITIFGFKIDLNKSKNTPDY